MPAKQPPDPQFVQSVRNALAHLYDDPYLQNHPLAYRTAGEAGLDQATRAQRFRGTLLDCIEQLRPQRAGGGPGSTRAYAILSYRYLDGLSAEEIAAKLALSSRQVYREHDKGVKAVAGLLHDALPGQGTEAETPALRPSGLADRSAAAREEIDRLRQAAHPEPIDALEALEDVMQLVRPLTQERGVRIILAHGAALPQVVADRVMLRQALVSLLSRGVERMRRGEVMAGLSPVDGGVLIDLNSAAGGPAPAVPAMQDALNVEVARALIEAQGGRLELQGSEAAWRARVFLPSPARATVLVVDDNPGLISLIQRYLGGYAVSVAGASDGRQALRLASELQPELIILDVMMPSQDGWDVLRRLKSSPDTKRIPIVVCSVLNEPYLAKAMGAGGYIAKPVSQAGLLEALRPWLKALQPDG